MSPLKCFQQQTYFNFELKNWINIKMLNNLKIKLHSIHLTYEWAFISDVFLLYWWNIESTSHSHFNSLNFTKVFAFNTLITGYFRFKNKNPRLRAELLNTALLNKTILFRNFYIPNGYSHWKCCFNAFM